MDYEQRISKIEQDVAEVKTSQTFLKEMLERNTKTNEKLVATLSQVEQSMVSINDNLRVQSKEISTIKKELDNTTNNFDKKISMVENKIDSIDEEGKFNIRLFLKNYFPWIVVTVGMVANFLSKLLS